MCGESVSFQETVWGSGFTGITLEPAAIASQQNLLEMRIFRPFPRSVEFKTQVGPGNPCVM